jgi:hypothetical protein
VRLEDSPDRASARSRQIDDRDLDRRRLGGRFGEHDPLGRAPAAALEVTGHGPEKSVLPANGDVFETSPRLRLGEQHGEDHGDDRDADRAEQELAAERVGSNQSAPIGGFGDLRRDRVAHRRSDGPHREVEEAPHDEADSASRQHDDRGVEGAPLLEAHPHDQGDQERGSEPAAVGDPGALAGQIHRRREGRTRLRLR